PAGAAARGGRVGGRGGRLSGVEVHDRNLKVNANSGQKKRRILGRMRRENARSWEGCPREVRVAVRTCLAAR
ncbi:hypothetical protein, partial [Caulobacter sp. D5]|uniref:hypothetical protein n=1 Tax=Caulobacter sp. D5 TaxID=357400 RepID=UPI001E43CB40